MLLAFVILGLVGVQRFGLHIPIPPAFFIIHLHAMVTGDSHASAMLSSTLNGWLVHLRGSNGLREALLQPSCVVF